MRIRRTLLVVAGLAIALFLCSNLAMASIEWCDGGCPPGLAKNDNEKPFEATEDNEHVDLHLVHPKVGNTVVTGATPAAEHNHHFADSQ